MVFDVPLWYYHNCGYVCLNCTDEHNLIHCCLLKCGNLQGSWLPHSRAVATMCCLPPCYSCTWLCYCWCYCRGPWLRHHQLMTTMYCLAPSNDCQDPHVIPVFLCGCSAARGPWLRHYQPMTTMDCVPPPSSNRCLPPSYSCTWLDLCAGVAAGALGCATISP